MDGPCSVLRGGSMRGLSSFNRGSDIFSNRGGHPHPNMAVRCGGASAPPAPAPVASSSAAWDAQDEPLGDIDASLPDMLAAPTLRSVSSLFMSIDAAEEGVSSSAEVRNRTNNMANRSMGGPVSGSKMVDELMSRLPEPPAPMGSCDNLTREQSFPPPFRPRFVRDQSFPPPVQAGGLTDDMLPSASSIGAGSWSHGGGSTAAMAGSVFGNGGGGGGPSVPKFHGLGFPGGTSTSTGGGNGSNGSNGDAPLRVKQPSPWGGDGAGGRGHPGGGTGGGSLEQHPVYASSSPRARRPSFDTLAGMIPGIPSWPALAPSPSSPQTPSSSSTAAVQAGELAVHVGGGGSGGIGGGGSGTTATPKVKPAPVPARPQASRLPPAAAGFPSPSSPSASSPTSPPSPSPQGRGRTSRPGKKPKKQHLRRADSPPPARWTASPSAATNPIKKSPSSGTGKRGVEMPPSCGPVRAGGGPADLAQLERRRVKIQRYLYKRSRRKFAKSTRDASPSRSRPKAAALRPRVKGKFVKTVPDFISVNAGQQAGEEMGGGGGGGGGGVGGMTTEAIGSTMNAASVAFPAVAQGGGGFGGRSGGGGGGGGGGVRSVRNGGSVNVNFDNGKAFSSTPSSSLMPRGVSGGGVHLPQVSALGPGAPNTMSWSTGPSPMSM